MGAAGSSGGGKKGQLLETMADHEESINCMVLRYGTSTPRCLGS